MRSSFADVSWVLKVGEKVVVIHDNVDITICDHVVGNVGCGLVFELTGVEQETISGVPLPFSSSTGSIDKQHVIPLSQAVDFLSDFIRSNPSDSAAYESRGLAYLERKELDKSIADFDEQIRLDPEASAAYCNRGIGWAEKGEYDRAIADYTTAILLGTNSIAANDRTAARHEQGVSLLNASEIETPAPLCCDAIQNEPDLDSSELAGLNGKALLLAKVAKGLVPLDDKVMDELDLWTKPQHVLNAIKIVATTYCHRGIAWLHKSEQDKAIADFADCIKVDGQFKLAYVWRGDLFLNNGEYDKAISDVDKITELDPNDSEPYHIRAWIWATCPDRRFRDGKKAVESATKACELDHWKRDSVIAVLAAAYAEAGDFQSAIKWQTNAMIMAPERAKANFSEVLDLYRSGKAFPNPPG